MADYEYISGNELETESIHNPDVFKKYFKFYKSKKKAPDLSAVLDFQSREIFEKHDVKLTELNCLSVDESEWKALGLISPANWRVFTIKECEGLYFIVNPFTSFGQWQWVKKCAIDYPAFPNKTNLDNICEKYEIKKRWPNLNTRDRLAYLENLRWITLGYHHNWDTKKYSEENKTPFPEDLAKLSSFIARVLNFKEFCAEAAIVHFYHLNSTLASHTDNSEYDLEAPLFSFSFGQSAIFLVGGKLKSVKPTPLYLRSGDVVVMAGSSRLAYHAVPKIIPSQIDPWMSNNLQNETDFKILDLCLQNYRININVRQVFPQSKK